MVIMKIFPILIACALAGSGLHSSGQVETKPASLKIGFNDVMEIIGGVFVGMALDVKAEDVAPCVSDTAKIGLELEQAFHYYMLKTYTGKVKAMALLGLAYKQLPTFMKDCEAGGLEEVEAIERMVLAFGHPLSVLSHMGENLVVNGADIMEETSLAMNAWQFEQYYDFGFYCGEAAFKILYVPPKNPTVDSQAAAQVVEGIAKFLQFDLKVESLSEEVGIVIQEALTKEFEFAGIADSLRLIGEGIEMACGEVDADKSEGRLGDRISKALEVLKEPSSLVVDKRLLMLNGIHLNHYMAIVVNFRNSDWENVGFYIGDMLATLSKALNL
jgi:hypothetical protein